MLHEFWGNFTHNLFKPLLLFFYFGFLISILRVRFEFPYVIYQGLTTYLLLAIGWHGGEELARINPVGDRQHRWVPGPGLHPELRDRFRGLLSARPPDRAAPRRPRDGRRLLRVGLGRNFRHLRGRACQRRHRL